MTSPYRTGSPVAGLRVNRTPVPESTLRLPKTIAWTVTAVPRSSAIPSRARYVRARSLFHERKTASTASRSCAQGSSGTSSTPTTSRNIALKRCRQFLANFSLPDEAARPAVVASVRPRLRMVSIMPGIETGAPDRTLTRSGVRRAAKRLADEPLDPSHVLPELGVQARRPAVGEILDAGRGRDRERRRNGKAEVARHDRQVGGLATEQPLHIGEGQVGALVAVVDVAHVARSPVCRTAWSPGGDHPRLRARR